MSNIRVDHAASELYQVQVLRRERVTPNMTRVTFGGEDLWGFHFRGFDHWGRLALPVHGAVELSRLPSSFGLGGYLKYLQLPKDTRPVIRNYTFRQFRDGTVRNNLRCSATAGQASGTPELDIDFVVHGEEGIAGPWAQAVQPGTPAAFIDQGCGFAPVPADWTLVVADESALPAAVGILRDLPREARGHALIEVLDARDVQDVAVPPGMAVRWLVREPGAAPGSAALPALWALEFAAGQPYAFAAGESALATGARRHLVKDRGVPKQQVHFVGYWKAGRAAA